MKYFSNKQGFNKKLTAVVESDTFGSDFEGTLGDNRLDGNTLTGSLVSASPPPASHRIQRNSNGAATSTRTRRSACHLARK